jgi:hypothetical protein
MIANQAEHPLILGGQVLEPVTNRNPGRTWHHERPPLTKVTYTKEEPLFWPLRAVIHQKPSRDETSRKHTRTQPETRAGEPLTSPRTVGDNRDPRRRKRRHR